MRTMTSVMIASLALGLARRSPAADPSLMHTGSDARDATPALVEREKPLPLLVPRRRTKVVVLTYHDIGPRPNGRTVVPRMFQRHMQTLLDHGISVVKLSALVEFLEGKRLLPERAAVLMFDDGDNRMAAHAVPLLEKLGFPYTLSLPTSPIDFASRAGRRRTKGRIFDWQGVNALIATGLCEVASHGHFHESLLPNNKYARATELLESRDRITSNVGEAPTAFVFPMGYVYPGSNADLARAGYRAGFTTQQASVVFDTDRYRIPRVMVDGDVTDRLVELLLRRVGLIPASPRSDTAFTVRRWKHPIADSEWRTKPPSAAVHRIPR